MGRWGPPKPNEYVLLPGGLARLTLTRGLFTLIDAVDLDRARRYRWHAVRCGLHDYAATNLWVDRRKRTLYLHRWLLDHDQPHTDHVNGDTLDNRRANLRPATVAQNRSAHRVLPLKSSRYRGVTWDKARGRWLARVKHEGRVYQRRFSTEEEAARWYDAQAGERFGDFATLNFPTVLH